jgi:hypothetical protein
VEAIEVELLMPRIVDEAAIVDEKRLDAPWKMKGRNNG